MTYRELKLLLQGEFGDFLQVSCSQELWKFFFIIHFILGFNFQFSQTWSIFCSLVASPVQLLSQSFREKEIFIIGTIASLKQTSEWIHKALWIMQLLLSHKNSSLMKSGIITNEFSLGKFHSLLRNRVKKRAFLGDIQILRTLDHI
jgi:hypothetical protein